jgi:hypothetical protein
MKPSVLEMRSEGEVGGRARRREREREGEREREREKEREGEGGERRLCKRRRLSKKEEERDERRKKEDQPRLLGELNSTATGDSAYVMRRHQEYQKPQA